MELPALVQDSNVSKKPWSSAVMTTKDLSPKFSTRVSPHSVRGEIFEEAGMKPAQEILQKHDSDESPSQAQNRVLKPKKIRSVSTGGTSGGDTKHMRGRYNSVSRKIKSKKSKGMDWLYMMITSRAALEKYEFSSEARKWIRKRLDAANDFKVQNQVTTRKRHGSLWNEARESDEKRENLMIDEIVMREIQEVESQANLSNATLYTNTLDRQHRGSREEWKNKKGFKSLQVNILSGDFTEVFEEDEVPNVFLALSLGEIEKTTQKLHSLKPNWRERMIFPVTKDCMYLNVVAMKDHGTPDDVLGTIQLPMVRVEKLKQSAVILQLWNEDQSEVVDCELTVTLKLVKDPPPSDEVRQGSVGKHGSGGGLTYIRTLVSKKKCRYVEGGFDLDLSYITDQLIAMGFPSEGVEAAFRNPMVEVQKFFKLKHADSFAVYNLCSERAYDPDRFPIVKRFPFDDHNPCPFDVLVSMCRDVKAYLKKDPKNVAAIHCKAGKGRTGLAISAYLIYSGVVQTADEALKYFAGKRTKDGQGVTIQSQRRYVGYFEEYVKLRRIGKQLPDRTLLLYSIAIKHVAKSSEDIHFTIKNQSKTYKSEKLLVDRHNHKSVSTKWIEFSLERAPIPLYKDTKVIFFKNRNEKMYHFWFNTQFVESWSLVLKKSVIDKASRDKKNKKFPKDMEVELLFAPRPGVAREAKRNSLIKSMRSPMNRTKAERLRQGEGFLKG